MLYMLQHVWTWFRKDPWTSVRAAYNVRIGFPSPLDQEISEGENRKREHLEVQTVAFLEKKR